MAPHGVRIALAAWSLWLAAPAASAHELSESRATIVLRDDNHLTVTLYASLPELLFRTLSSGKSFGAFLVQYSALDPTAFQRELLRAEAQVERGTRLFLEDGRQLALGHWTWPGPAAAQAMLRERVMQETVGSDPDAHGEPAEIRAEGVAAQPIRAVTIEFPPELQRVLVVAYRPTQTTVAAGTRSARIGFQPAGQ